MGEGFDATPGRPGIGEPSEDAPVDVSRAVAALRRGSWLILLIVVPLTTTVLLLSLALPKSYRATTTLVVSEREGLLGSANNDSAQRRLATLQALVTSRSVLTAAAAQLPGETVKTLEGKVSAQPDALASILEVEATDGDPRGAAAIANRVVDTFLDREQAAARRRIDRARRELQGTLDRLPRSATSAAEVRAIRERLSELSVSEASVGEDLAVAEPARPPERPHAPRPVQNTVIALAAASFLAILVALARDRVAPRVKGPRELTRLTGLPALALLPATNTRLGDRGLKSVFHALQTSVRARLPASERVILVASAAAGTSASRISAGLGAALAASGRKVLLVAADLQRSTLHQLFELSNEPGLSSILATADDASEERLAEQVAEHAQVPREASGDLSVIPAGTVGRRSTALLLDEPLGALLEGLRRSPFQYVLVDGPPLLGSVDGQLVARLVDAVLIVCEPDRLSPAAAVELAEGLAALDATALGTVVVAGRSPAAVLPGAWASVPGVVRAYGRHD